MSGGGDSATSSPAACEQYFNAVCVVQVEVVQAGPRLHVVYLRHPTVNVCRRDNDIRVICSPGVTDSRSLDDAGRDFPQSRDIRDAHLLVEECGVHDMTNWLIVGRLVMVCRIVMRSAVVEPDGWKAN